MSAEKNKVGPYAIGVDIGGTKINVGLISREGSILLETSLPTLAAEGKVLEQAMTGITAVLSRMREEYPGIEPIGIGVGSAGQINFEKGTVHFATELIPGYTGTPIREKLEAAFGLPVMADNDVNVFALAELHYGAARDARHVLCLTLGTGVGGAVISDGRLIHGAVGAAGEIGHLVVDFRGVPCNCGARGCLEMYASGTGIARLMREKSPDRPGDAREAIAGWLAGEETGTAVMREAIEALGAALAGLIHTLNPEIIIIGGGVAEAGEPLFAAIREEVGKRAMASMAGGVRIVPAVMGNRSGMAGAASQFWT